MPACVCCVPIAGRDRLSCCTAGALRRSSSLLSSSLARTSAWAASQVRCPSTAHCHRRGRASYQLRYHCRRSHPAADAVTAASKPEGNRDDNPLAGLGFGMFLGGGKSDPVMKPADVYIATNTTTVEARSELATTHRDWRCFRGGRQD